MKEELKIKDVMIGDWVDVRNNAAPNTPHLERITPSHFLRDEHWYGVELVPEILEKNGFREITGRVKRLVWAWRGVDKYIEVSEVTPNVYQIVIHKDASDLGDERVFVRHLHGLQHALKLFGIEKTIEL